MRSSWLAAVIVFLISPVAVLQAEDERRDETEHLIIQWSEGVSHEAIDAAKSEGEKYYLAVRDLLGYEPDNRVIILLQGPAERPDGSRGYPHVDVWGRIHLYQFEGILTSYFTALAHEMVHVFRRDGRPKKDWFFEEGFAEFIARRVSPSLHGFPWYGFDVVLVAGQWIANGEDIPLTALRDRHKELNLPCKAQSYALRAAFFNYLGETYGDDVVLKMADEERAGAPEDYRRYFGRDLEELEAEWREALMKAYREIDNVDDVARRYRRESPIQYMRVCEKDKNF